MKGGGALGAVAAQCLLGTTESVGRLRGRFHPCHGGKLMCTYHPAYLLRAPSEKRKVWDDMLTVMKQLGMPISERQRAYFR